MKFTAATCLPIASVTTLAQSPVKYIGLDDAQRALLEAVENVYPFERYGLVRAAREAGRLYVTGADVFALAARKHARVDEQETDALEQ